MKIVCLTHYYIEENRAGGELMLHQILKYLVKQGHDVTAVITDTVRSDSIVDGVRVIYNPFDRLLFDNLKPELIITQFQNTGVATRYAHHNQIPVCVIIHNDITLNKRFVQDLYATDFIIYNTEWVQKMFRSPCKSMVVHPPIMLEDKLPNPDEQKYITLVHLVQEKGSQTFYRLALNMPDVQFLAVKGGYWKHRQVVCEAKNITFLENTSEMFRDVYSKTKILLMPSEYESYGMVAAEAIGYGIPVLCTDLPGLHENLGVAGIYMKKDWLEWKSYIDCLLNNEELYKIQSEACLLQSQTRNPEAELSTMERMLEYITYARI